MRLGTFEIAILLSENIVPSINKEKYDTISKKV